MGDYLRVTAPFAGTITKRFADTGAMIQAGTSSSTQVMPVVRLSENRRLRLILPVPESAVPTVVLIPGMFAEVDLTLDHRDSVLTIPVTAFESTGDDAGRVMVVTTNNKIEVRDVVPGLQDTENVEIRSGLEDGDMVITANRASLRAGEEVRPKLTSIAAAP